MGMQMKTILASFSPAGLIISPFLAMSYFHCRPRNKPRIVWSQVALPYTGFGVPSELALHDGSGFGLQR